MITRIAHKYLDYRYKEIDSFINKPIETQEKILEYLLRNGEQTLFGQQFNFSAIKNKDDSVIVRIDKKVPYERVVKVLDLLQKYNLNNLALVTNEEKKN